MDKYIAFNLYRSGWTTQGAAVAVPLEPDAERREVYLASDVEKLLKKIADERLDWGMRCDCHCDACAHLDAVLNSLMVR